MSDAFELNCSVRTEQGKGASRRLRRLNNQIPAILYGGGKDPVSLTISHDDIFHATENEAFFSHIITLNIDNTKEKAVIKDLQRHPAKPFIVHADFLRVKENEAIVVNVPIHFINEEKCVGVKLHGGNILKTLTEIEVSCLPKDLPEYIEVDMLNVDVGDTVHLSDVTLPEGVTSVALTHGEDSDLSVAIVQQPRGGDDSAAGDSASAAESKADDEGEDKSSDND
ncbi:MAG: 50S ribosomal protein L25/general stress protein Ctc [Proteobacteria bacterium]|nr:50S ribosomal protein L25/general stress protein Ctc [Pseudomonadota bacterium]MDA0926681.1 50S ribosomal protein L25/general stress protein Ctc [Pseudomonadota bacterium]